MTVTSHGLGQPGRQQTIMGSDTDKQDMVLPATGEAFAPRWWRQLREALAGLPEVEAARVARTTHAIQNGSFSINPDRVAANLLAFERQRRKSG